MALPEFGMDCASCPCFNQLQDAKGKPAVNQVGTLMGECCRYPPQVVVMQSNIQLSGGAPPSVNSAFPPTAANGHCWEYPQMMATANMMRRALADQAQTKQ